MKFVEMFAGIGGMSQGIKNSGFECVGFAEWDKYAHQAYNILHNKNGKLEEWYDVRSATDIDLERFRDRVGGIDLLAGGFPCQSFSLAGKRGGFNDTRGTLFFEIARWARALKPTTLLLENVKGLFSHDKGKTFRTVLDTLGELGYDVEWQLFNSKNYVPQNRERVFIVGHLRGSSRRKIFPFRQTNGESLTYSTNEIKVLTNISLTGYNAHNVHDISGIIPTLAARDFKGPKLIYDINVVGRLDIKGNDQIKRVYGIDGISPTLSTMQGGNRQPKIQIPIQEATKQGYAIAEVGDGINIGRPSNTTRRGRVGKGVAQTLETSINMGTIDGNRIRKLTPLECFRLQSFPDEWYYTLKKHNFSDTQLYKMAGNAVTSVVAEDIARRIIHAEN